jgi:transcriptional regulator of arginine metabolism
MTSARHRAIRRLLATEHVATQAELLGLLSDEGIMVTQATVSRDLKEIGAVRRRDDDGTNRYRIAEDRRSNNGELARTLEEYALDITPTGGLVVVATLPGAAHVVGRAIDEAGIDGIVGTVAGDDTVLVVAGPGVVGDDVAWRLEGGR